MQAGQRTAKQEHMKPIVSEIIPPREENEVNILNYST